MCVGARHTFTHVFKPTKQSFTSSQLGLMGVIHKEEWRRAIISTFVNMQDETNHHLL